MVFLIFLAQLEEIAQYGRIDSLQPPSLFWRQEADAMPYCVKNNISILAYSPLARLLTGKLNAVINSIQ